MKATTREDLNLKEDEKMCEKCVHEDICRREQCGEPYVVIRSCFDFEKKRPHGEWIESKERKGHFYCSECVQQDVSGKWRELFDYKYNFCPNCGADMRGVKK